MIYAKSCPTCVGKGLVYYFDKAEKGQVLKAKKCVLCKGKAWVWATDNATLIQSDAEGQRL